jgi:Ca2+-binding EF-hand superfamily protein
MKGALMRLLSVLFLVSAATGALAQPATAAKILPAKATPAVHDTTVEDWNMLRCMADMDKDDKISAEEVQSIRLDAVRTLQRDFAQMDANHDGVVSAKEYADYIHKQRAAWESDFQSADTDKSGGLSKVELAKTKPGEFIQIKRQFDAMDANHDGEVTPEERDGYLADRAKRQAARTAAAKPGAAETTRAQ